MAELQIAHCRNCSSGGATLEWCACGIVKYCSERCRHKDRRRHSAECEEARWRGNAPTVLPEAHERVLGLLLDQRTGLGRNFYPFLHVRAVRDVGELVVVPLVGTDIPCRLGISSECAVLCWSPTTSRRKGGEAPTFMYVTDARDWKACSVMTYSARHMPDRQQLAPYELEMERSGFFSGRVSAVIASTGQLVRVATAEVYPRGV
jgi:hypothetical protein